MEMLLKNVRYALRSLRKHPGFTAIALVTLALGIGANTAIFSLVRAVLLAPLPYPDPGRLVQVWPEKPVSVEQALAFDGADASFDAIAPYGSSRLSLTGQGRPEQLLGTQVGHRFFGALGVTPTLGRAFRRDEQRPGAQPVAIISNRLWQTRFGGSVDTIGRELRLGGTSRTVIGVMPEQHRSLVPATDVWLPISEDPASDLYRDWAVFRLLGHSRIGRGCLIAAGAVVPPGLDVPDEMVVMGVPGRITRQTNEADRAYLAKLPDHYIKLARRHVTDPNAPIIFDGADIRNSALLPTKSRRSE